MKTQDGKPAFEKFLEGMNGLLGDRHFREVLLELDGANAETLSQLAHDPAAFLRYRGVRVPEDFRFSLAKHPEPASRGLDLRIDCRCLQICWLRWCVWICACRVATAS